MRARLLTAAVLAAGLAVSAAPSQAAAPAPQLADAKGDANFLNGQGFVDGAPNPASDPASVASMDITSVQWATKFVVVKKKKVPTDVIVTMTLAGPLADQGKSAIWRAMWNVGDCQFLASYETTADAAPDGGLRVCSSDPADTLGYHDYSAKITATGNKIVWTLPLKSLKPLGVKPGTVFEALTAHARLVTGASLAAATVLTADEAASDKVYKVGS